jgi:signal transduction histidine kinase
MFRWECDPSGEIAWVEGAPRGALVGRSIARRQAGEGVDEQVERAFAMRAPFRDAGLQLAGDAAIAGSWKISGIPAFSGGRFEGYRGVAAREATRPSRAMPLGPVANDPDSMRELVHELKTPLNAIIGFAEIIDAQLLGEASDAYRKRAQEIVAQARLLLTAIEDLDFTARHASAGSTAPRTVHLGTLIEQAIGQLRATATMRGVAIDASRSTGDLTAATAPQLAERLVMRMCNAVIGEGREGERLRLSDEDLFRVSGSPSEGGYWLLLARNLARMVGADLVTSARDIALTFPRA